MTRWLSSVALLITALAAFLALDATASLEPFEAVDRGHPAQEWVRTPYSTLTSEVWRYRSPFVARDL